MKGDPKTKWEMRARLIDSQVKHACRLWPKLVSKIDDWAILSWAAQTVDKELGEMRE